MLQSPEAGRRTPLPGNGMGALLLMQGAGRQLALMRDHALS